MIGLSILIYITVDEIAKDITFLNLYKGLILCAACYKKGTPKLVIPKKDHFHWEKEWIINGKGELINTNK